MLRDATQHAWANLVAVVEGKHIVRPGIARQDPVRPTLPLQRPAESEQCRVHLSRLGRTERIHAARNVTVRKNGELLTSRDQIFPSQMHTFDELIVWSQRKNWARVSSLCASDSVALKFRNLTKNIPVQKWAVIEEDGDTILKCRIPDTNRIAVMGKVGRSWKLTKIEQFKDEN